MVSDVIAIGNKVDIRQVSQIENDSGYTTQAYVDNAIGNVLTQEEF